MKRRGRLKRSGRCVILAAVKAATTRAMFPMMRLTLLYHISAFRYVQAKASYNASDAILLAVRDVLDKSALYKSALYSGSFPETLCKQFHRNRRRMPLHSCTGRNAAFLFGAGHRGNLLPGC